MELGVGDNPEYHMASDSLTARRKAGEPMPTGAADREAMVAEDQQRVMREWVPLAQFGTVDEVYYGRFMIRHDDLAARRFDKAQSYTMFTE